MANLQILDSFANVKLTLTNNTKLLFLVLTTDKTKQSTCDMLKTFLKEAGEEGATQVEKLTVKKKDLEGKEGDVVVIASSV